jgi:hypothetical protein
MISQSFFIRNFHHPERQPSLSARQRRKVEGLVGCIRLGVNRTMV